MIQCFFRTSKVVFQASFRKFAQTAIKVEKISSTISKQKIMSEYFQSSTEEEKHSIVNILNFIKDRPKTGLANKSLISYLNVRYLSESGYAAKNFEEIIDMLEDDQAQDTQGTVTLEGVNQFLEKIKSTQGKGSIKKKIEMLDQILDQMNVIQIKIFMRILAKNLRIGMTEKTFSFKKDHQESKVQKRTKKEGETNEESKICNPTPKIELMLAKPLRTLKQVQKFCESKGDQKLIADLKYDGQRTLIIYKKGVDIQLLSRNHKWQTEVYKPLATLLYQQLQKNSQINSIQIDGEIVCVQMETGEHLPMQKILNKRGKEANEDQNSKLTVFAFDVLQLNGQEFFNKELKTRRMLIPTTEHISVSECIQFKYPEEKQKLLYYYKLQLEKKHEGLIIKGENDHYFINGSRRHWGKFKKGCKIESQNTGEIDLDLVVMGVMNGEGKNSSKFSAFLLGVYHQGKLHPVSKVGTGFTEAQLDELTELFAPAVLEQKPENYEIPKTLRVNHFVKPQKVFQVTCQDLSRSPQYKLRFEEGEGGISLRFPVFQRLRDDKDPLSCKSDDLFQFLDSEENK